MGLAALLSWAAPLAAAGADGAPGEDLVKVRVTSAAVEQGLSKRGARLVARYDAFSVWELPAEKAGAIAGRSSGVEVLALDNKVLLNTGAIDTATPEAQALRRPLGAFDGNRLHLVQFAGPVKPAWYQSLLATGVQVIQPIPSNAYLVWGDSSALGKLQSLARSNPAFQWDGAYEADYKVQPDPMAGGGKKGDDAPPDTGRYQVQLVRDLKANADTFTLLASLKTGDIRQRYEILSYVNFTVGLSEDAVKLLAQRDDVVSIAKWVEPKKRDERQNQIMAGQLTGNAPTPGDYLAYLTGKGFTQAQFDASNFAVDVTDSGVDNATTTPNHFGLHVGGDPAAAGRVVYARLEGTPNGGSTIQGCDGHGTLNTHIVCGYVPTGGIFAAAPHADASGFRYGLGVAPFVRAGSSVIFDPGTFTDPSYPDLQSRAYRDSSRLSTNSWGANVGGAYTTDSQAYDALVRDAQPTGSAVPAAGNQEMVIFFSAGNAGSGANTIGSPGTAKNVITVGATEGVQAFGGADNCGLGDVDANSANDVVWFSSRGPTDDGRKKPEIVAPGSHISGGVFQATLVNPVSGNGAAAGCFDGSGVCGGPSGSNFFPTTQQWYSASSGTSHSTPAVAGAGALIRQYFINQSLAPPSPAMTKALLMNTARYMNGAGANDNLWSNNQGMGDANIDSFFDIFTELYILRDQVGAEMFTASGQTRTFTGTVVNPAKPFRVTLAWTDAPGPTTGNAYVNNLDLEVTVGGNTYKGNVFTGAFSSTGGTADGANNAESVFVPAGVTGSFVVKVTATNIAGDGVPGVGTALDQDFALIVTNADAEPIPVIGKGASTLTAEDCAPPNTAIDPGETVTVEFELLNVGTGDTTDLVATLQATGGVSSPSAPQSYGALVAGGPSVTMPFTFTASSTCGQTITATLQLQDGAADLGTVVFTFATGALGAPITATYGTGNISTLIPDPGTVDIPIAVADTGVVADVKVKVRIDHSWDGDVQLSLVSPAGTVIPLVTSRGSSGDNFGTGANDCSGTPTVFDDAAATAISAGTPPFAGSYRPESPLSGFDGQTVTGTWYLRATDTTNPDQGTVGCVQLEINRQRYVCCGVPGTPQIVSGGSATVVAGGTNGVPDPGETVTVDFPLVNIGDGATTNLVATLQSSGGVTPVTTTQNYGAMAAAPTPVTRSFTFTAAGACGDTITATLQLQDGATDLGTVAWTFTLGATTTSSQTFTNAAAITIPTSGAASPYPSPITVSGIATLPGKVTVKLKGFSHTWPNDVDMLLVSPTGVKMIVLSDTYSSTDAVNVDITLDDAAAALLPSSGTPATGTYRPTDYTSGDTFVAPAPGSPYLSPATVGSATFASAFLAGTAADLNGTWNLYVVDDASGDTGSISGGWELTFSTTSPACETPCTPPAAPTGVPASRCGTGTVGLSASGAGAGEDYRWYAISGGAPLQATGAAFTTPSITTTTDFAVAVYNTTTGCESPRTTVTATVTPLPTTPTAGNDGPACVGGTVNLTASTVAGATYAWTGPNGFASALQNPVLTNVQAVDGGLYSVTVNDGTCTSLAGTTTVVVNPIPAAPTAGSEATVCQGETIHLTASTVTGATYSWTGPDGFLSAAQNPTITNAQPAASGVYSVTVTVDGCTSAPATTTTTVTPDSTAPVVTPPAPVVVFQTLCCGTFGGADSDTSATLATFLAGGTATDDCTATALTPQVGGVDVTGTTCFE
ncbi:MAG: hypothetical protein EDX89_20710, partial [Acidobacteria bacterium]